MRPQWLAASIVALALAGTAALLVAVGLASFALYLAVPIPETLGWPLTAAFAIGVVTFAAAGAVIATARPGNRIAWLVLGIGVGGSVIFMLERVGAYLEFARGEALGRVLVAVSSPLVVFTTGVLLTLVPLLFPDGRLPSPRWRPMVWLMVTAMVLAAIGSFAEDDYLILGLPNVFRVDSAALRVAYVVGIAMLLVGAIAALGSLIARYRSADPTTRAQLRWFGFAAGLFSALVIGVLLVFGVTSDPTLVALLSAAHSLFPLAILVAVLRYRLYDIDVLIHRTLVYGLTSAAIAVAFFGGIVVLQSLLRPFTGGSEIAVAASTLAGFALVQPIRRGIQHSVDRRFYRARYDAQRTLDDFAVRLRDDVELESVRAQLIGAVAQTMAPAHASLWLRKRTL
jgi:hypothetical protein